LAAKICRQVSLGGCAYLSGNVQYSGSSPCLDAVRKDAAVGFSHRVGVVSNGYGHVSLFADQCDLRVLA
jgi:hypothetical protein